MTYLRLESLTRRFSATAGVFDLSLSLARGKTLALLGPSGSGKTTTLRLLGGFERPERGRSWWMARTWCRSGPSGAGSGWCFSTTRCSPISTSGENVAFGLESLGVRRRTLPGGSARRWRWWTSRASSGAGSGSCRVASSSGWRWRGRWRPSRGCCCSMSRSPISIPRCASARGASCDRLIRRVGITTVIVTHEQEEAFDLGDGVAVLRDGRLEQVGTPETLYGAPATPFVGSFIGRSSWLAGT